MAAGFFMAACGGSSATTGTGSPTTTAQATAPSTPAQLAADKALAGRAVLTQADLPGYHATPHDKSEDDTPPAVLRKFATCVHVPKATLESMLANADDPNSPSVDAPDFDLAARTRSSQGVHIENSVELDRSVSDISRPVKLLGARSALKCWQTFFDAAAGIVKTAGVTEHFTVVPLARLAVGDESASFEVRIVATRSGVTDREFLDFYLVGRGRAGIALLVEASVRPMPVAFARSLLTKVVDRVDAG